MGNKYESLFSPLKIGGVTVKNRIAMMPMGVFSPRLMGSDGAYTKQGADYYIERARGGAGLIITGLVPVVPNPVFYILKDAEEYVRKTSYLADGIHAYGGRVFIQLSALTGRAGHGGEFPAPSELPNVWDPTIKSRMITKDEIRQYIENFAQGAYLVKRAGCDGVEVHAVHEGYLLDQFAIALMNTRTDEYGGSLENRLRFATEIVKAIKAKCGENFPVSLRYSVRSYMKDFNRGALPGESFIEKGRDLGESLIAAKMLQDAGYDLLNCDNGSYDSWYWAHPPMYMPKACNLEDAARVKQAVTIPVICAGRFDDPELAEKAIRDGCIDMMGLGRPLLADSDFVYKLAHGDASEIRPCISCHQGCLSRIFQGLDISCAVNPACGREEEYELKPASSAKRILVVGGGPGGLEAARICAERGHTVDLIEKSGTLGGVFKTAAIPDFKEDDKRLLSWYEQQLRKLEVSIQLDLECTAELINTGDYDEIILATGAVERRFDVPGLTHDNCAYAIDALKRGTIPGKNVIIVGGGLTGCELAYIAGRQGKNVTLIERTETILNAFGLSAANYNMLMELLDFYKVRVIKNAVLQKVDNGVATVCETVKNYPNIANRAMLMYAVDREGIPVTHELAADYVIVSVGYTSDDELYSRANADNVHLIGDAKMPANVMEAIWTAYELAKDL